MNTERKEAYRHLLYAALIQLRNGYRPSLWNPMDWFRSVRQWCFCKDLADCLHNLAFFSIHEFHRFDEDRFWSDLLRLERQYERGLHERYRKIFDLYLSGQAALV
jgi:hypothetical protein